MNSVQPAFGGGASSSVIIHTMGSRLLTVITRLKPFTICGRHAVASTTTTTTTPTVRGFTSTARSLVQQDRNDAFGLEEKEWQFDDISSAGHDELEQHREAREYARIAAYEMPLLHRTSLLFPLYYSFFLLLPNC